MTIIAKASEKEFESIPLPEAGTVQAVCCGVWDLGMQESTYNGETKLRHKIVIAWELAQLIDVPTSEYHGMPYMLSKTYTLSLYENAALKKDLESWRGKAYTKDEIVNGVNVEKLYGINCLLGVTHVPGFKDTTRTFANVSSILPPIKGMEKILPVRKFEDAPPKWVTEKQAQAVDVKVKEQYDNLLNSNDNQEYHPGADEEPAFM
jgi:hypothetical protein